MTRYLVVGAGFTGAVIAERIASQSGRRVLVIDRRSHIGGNAYDHADANGVIIHPHGPHIFHTSSTKVVDYLSRFTAWRPYEHRVRAWIDNQLVPLPFNFTTMELVFGTDEGARHNALLADEYGAAANVPILKMRESSHRDIRRVADTIYEKVFLHYTVKQWGLSPEELDASVSARVPVRLSRDDRYFLDPFQKMPAEGYTRLFQRLLDHPLIEVRTGVSFTDIAEAERFAHVIYTGPIDAFFDYRHGPLPYRSLRFDLHATEAKQPLQCCGSWNYPTPAEKHPYTRVTEFRFLTGQSETDWTTRAFEYPQSYEPGRNEPYYPIPRAQNREVFRRYAADAKKLRTVTFAGRLADYQYYNMDQAVARALSCFARQVAPFAA